MMQVPLNTIMPKNLRDNKNGLHYISLIFAREHPIPFLSDVGGVRTNSTLKATAPACILQALFHPS